MEKESNYLSSVILLTGALFSSGLYLALFHLHPAASWIFLILTIGLGGLGVIKLCNHFAQELPRPLRRFVYWVHSIAFEALAIGASFLMKPFGYGAGVNKTCGQEKGRPILMIHGYLQNASNWAFLKRTLCKRGVGPIYTLNLMHPFRSISEYAELVDQKAKAIAIESKSNDLIVIGHSMGGLVGAWYAAKFAKPGKVSDVITIGSPMNGTKWAAIAIGSNGREMRCDSEFVRQLQTEFRKDHSIRFFHIASKTDEIILPYSSALTGLFPEREYLLEDLGHMSLLYSSRVADKIEEWITGSKLPLQ